MSQSIIAILLLAAAMLIGWAQRTWYFSSSQGSDTNDGRTPSTPLRSIETLQRLLWGSAIAGDHLRRGDTLAFLRGDTFRVVYETPTGLRYGISFNSSILRQPGDPVVVTAYGPQTRPAPLFTGTWRLSDRLQGILQEGTLIKIAKPFGGHDSLVALRLFYKGQPLRPARFPDDSLLINWRGLCATLSDNDSIVAPPISTLLSPTVVQGALLFGALGSDYSWGCTRVTQMAGDTLIFYSIGRPETFLRGSRFYLEGKKEFISQPGEWYYDEATDTLYLWPPVLPFDPTEYEALVVRVRPTDRQVEGPQALLLTTRYDTLPSDPIQQITVQNLHFFGLLEGIRTAGVREVTIQNCIFSHSHRGVWNLLADRLYVHHNEFKDNESRPISISGRTVSGFQGNPKALTRRVYVEHNRIKRTGLHPRWDWQTLRIDSSRFVLEDYSIIIGYNIDSVIIRYNWIDSVSQGGILGNCFYYTQSDWNSTYAGTTPFIVEKNLITNFCMDFSDCGGIKFFSFMQNGIVRDNILLKGTNRDKSHLSHPGRPGAKGLYSDVSPYDIIWDGNTVIGTSIGCGNSPGGGPIRNIKIRNNTFYGCQRIGTIVSPNTPAGAQGCEVVGNTFFLDMQESGAVVLYDAAPNQQRDTFDKILHNQYGHPTYAVSYLYRHENGTVSTYGFRSMRQNTPYENSPLSRWLHWVAFREWHNAQVTQSLLSNPSLNPAQNLPIAPFGRARLTHVPTSPLGTPAYLLWYPDTAQAGIPSGIIVRSTEPLYSTLLDSAKVYRWSIVWASTRAQDYPASVSWPRYLHPNTGDTLATNDRFILPTSRPYTPETLHIRYQPRFRQFWTQPRIEIQKGDSIWITYWNFEEIDKNSIPSLQEVYPIFINPSDTVARFPLPSGWLYLSLDSTLVWGSVSVQPWKSRILIRLRYDPTYAHIEGQQPLRSWAIAYPNPTTTAITVIVPEAAHYALYSFYGQLLRQGSIAETETLSLESLPAGIYLLHLRYRGGFEETIRVQKLE